MQRESSPAADARAWVDVDLGALVRNARALELQARAPIIPMVKADGYGLGAAAVALALETISPMAYGVATIGEGEELRAAGISRPILLFTPALVPDLPRIRASEITPSLASREGIESWMATGGGAWHLSIDTGMHRTGATWDDIEPLLDSLQRWTPDGAFTHFHSAQLEDGSLERQEERFRAAVARLPVRPAFLHAENSAAITRRSRSPWDCVRPGIFLYGVGSGGRSAIQPEPVASLRARIVEFRTIAAGETVSYDATWRAPSRRRIATVGCGYADGLRRSLGNVGSALVGGVRVPIVGTVTMDMTMIDVTDVSCALGDAVTFLGVDGDSRLTAEEVAARGDFSPYELLTGLRMRASRRYGEGV